MSMLALHHIVVKSPWLAEDLLHELSLGADFGDLAAEFSCCPSAKNQGFAGHHDTNLLPANLVSALYGEDQLGPYRGPIHTQYGYHLLKVLEKTQRSLLLDDASL